MTTHALSSLLESSRARLAAVLLLIVGNGTFLAGCGLVGDAEARALQDELEIGHQAAFYVDELRSQGFQVQLHERSDEQVVLLATRGEEMFSVELNRPEPGAQVESLRVATIDEEERPEEIGPVEATIPAGAMIPVTLQTALSSAASQEGDRFAMTVTRDFQGSGVTAIPSGSVIMGTVRRAKPAERPQSGGVLVLEPVSLEIDGRSIRLNGSVTAEGRKLEGEGSHSADWEKIAAGAGVGGILGGVLKGGKGALAGVVIGGGGAFLATKGEELELSAGTPLTVELTSSTTVSRID